MCKWGYESGRGKAALDRMNWAHGHFSIGNAFGRADPDGKYRYCDGF